MLFVALAFDQLEERDVLGVEGRGGDAGFLEAGEDAADGVALVEFVEFGAARRAAAGGEFLVG